MVEIEFEKDENVMRMNELFDGDEDEGVGSFSVGLNQVKIKEDSVFILLEDDVNFLFQFYF